MLTAGPIQLGVFPTQGGTAPLLCLPCLFCAAADLAPHPQPHPTPQELIVDPKQLGSTPAGLEAAPGSHPNPLVSHASSGSGSASLALDNDPPGPISGSDGAAAAAAAGSSPTAAAAAAATAHELQRLALSSDDHPLSTSTSSKWKAYFQVGRPRLLPVAARHACVVPQPRTRLSLACAG